MLPWQMINRELQAVSTIRDQPTAEELLINTVLSGKHNFVWQRVSTDIISKVLSGMKSSKST